MKLVVMQKLVMRGLMLFSLSTLMFLYGFLCHEYRIFPFHYLREARVASVALAEVAKLPTLKLADDFRVRVDKPTVFQHAEHSDSPYIFVAAGGQMRLPGVENTAMAWVIDRVGKVMHAWRCHPDLWNQLQLVKRVPGISGPISPAGFHLYPDGSLLATFHGQNTYPFAVGIAKFDRDSKLLWKKELLAHHFFTLDKQGHILVPSMELVSSPMFIGNTAAMINSDNGTIYSDQILELDADGNEIDRISVLKILCDSGRHGLLTQMNSGRLDCEDPTHLNDIRVIDEEQAKSLPGIEAGDLLISLRNLNTLAIVDRQTKQVKWCSSGTTVGQHSPRVYRNGILVFDNLGGDMKLGGTRLVHIDYQNGQPTTLFPKPGVAMPDVCQTTYSGHIDIEQTGSHALACITNAGAVWEVDLESGQVVWEYIINDPVHPELRSNVGYACYLNDLAFLDTTPNTPARNQTGATHRD